MGAYKSAYFRGYFFIDLFGKHFLLAKQLFLLYTLCKPYKNKNMSQIFLPPHPIKPLPPAVKLRRILGPSFILLGLGLGSGEVILWPYLTSHYGLGIVWGAVIGLTFQFFMNMEIERYALTHGESIFVGFARRWRWAPVWFLLSTFIPWIWPGIIASSAAVFTHVIGLSAENAKYLTIGLLVLIGLILSLGPVLYKTVERFQKTLIFIGVPSVFAICLVLAKPGDFVAAAQGIVGIGDGYFLLPAGIIITSFLAALAYSGAGGNLNLSQSFYIKEKGFGMGKYAGRITSVLTGKNHDSTKSLLTGATFSPTKQNVREFKKWWRVVNTEHLIVFWLTGTITILLLTILAYTTTYGHAGKTAGDISFVIAEAGQIGQQLFPAIGTFFLCIVGLTLFGTQLTIYDAVSRIMTENFVLAGRGAVSEKRIPAIYYAMLWLFIVSGIVITLVGFNQPLQLLFLAAVMNAFAMFIHAAMTLRLNMKVLAEKIRPNTWRIVVMSMAIIFYGGFSIFVLVSEAQKLLMTL